MKCSKGTDSCFRCGPEKECLILTDKPKRRPCSFYKRATVDYDTAFIKQDYDGIWKRVRGWDGLYWVSSNGEVLGRSGIMKQRFYNGRVCVRFYFGEFKSVQYVHELVADAFVPGSGEIYFRDGNCFNCKAENLGRR